MTVISVATLAAMVQMCFLRSFSLLIVTPQSQDVMPNKYRQLPSNAETDLGVAMFVVIDTVAIIPQITKSIFYKVFIVNPIYLTLY